LSSIVFAGNAIDIMLTHYHADNSQVLGKAGSGQGISWPRTIWSRGQ